MNKTKLKQHRSWKYVAVLGVTKCDFVPLFRPGKERYYRKKVKHIPTLNAELYTTFIFHRGKQWFSWTSESKINQRTQNSSLYICRCHICQKYFSYLNGDDFTVALYRNKYISLYLYKIYYR